MGVLKKTRIQSTIISEHIVVPGVRTFEASMVFSEAHRSLRDQGFTVEVTVDFEGIPAILAALDKSYLVPVNAPSKNDFTSRNCFWLLLKRSDIVVAAVCARMDDLGREPIAQFWRRTYKRHYSGSDASAFVFVADNLLRDISGKTVYQGDFFVSPKYRFRKTISLLRDFARCLQALTFLEWDPDWVYAFMWSEHAEKGFSTIYGFTRCYPMVKRWSNGETNRRDDE